MADSEVPESGGRATGALLLLTTLAVLVLLAMHPGSAAKSFADLLKEEAANRTLNGLVHGGFVALLPVQIVCYAAFSARLNLTRLAPLAGLVFFAAGAVFLGASVFIDGLVIPAIAAKYAATPDKIDAAKSLFVLCGAAIRCLMPMGLAFQGASIMSWGAALLNGRARLAGAIGLVLGLGLLSAQGASIAWPNPALQIGGFLALTVWGLVTASLLLTRRV